jgi:hypothetical protein
MLPEIMPDAPQQVVTDVTECTICKREDTENADG